VRVALPPKRDSCALASTNATGRRRPSGTRHDVAGDSTRLLSAGDPSPSYPNRSQSGLTANRRTAETRGLNVLAFTDAFSLAEMQPPRRTQLAGRAGICAGVLYFIQGVILLFEPRSGGWLYVVYSLFAAAVVLTFLALRGLHALQRGRDSRLGVTGFYISSIGLARRHGVSANRLRTRTPRRSLRARLSACNRRLLALWCCVPHGGDAAALECTFAFAWRHRGNRSTGQARSRNTDGDRVGAAGFRPRPRRKRTASRTSSRVAGRSRSPRSR
jgi:hypothetical protein